MQINGTTSVARFTGSESNNCLPGVCTLGAAPRALFVQRAMHALGNVQTLEAAWKSAHQYPIYLMVAKSWSSSLPREYHASSLKLSQG
jgi:hypothetical protein